MTFTWKMSMALEIINHSDPPTGPCYWVFYRPEWAFIGKEVIFFKSTNTTVGKLIAN